MTRDHACNITTIVIVRVHCSGVATSSGGAARTLAHSFILTVALCADDRCGRALVSDPMGTVLVDDSVVAILNSSPWWFLVSSISSYLVTLSSKG